MARQLFFTMRTWGGKRRGAGRRPNGTRAGASHLRRPPLSRHHPVHVTLRVRRGLSTLRRDALFPAVRAALAAGRERFGFRLVHFSVQRDHLHLLAEAKDRRALSRGVQGLSIRVAKAVNRRLQRHGSVFSERYHARALKTPRQVRFVIRYVLLNARKHERGLSRIPSGFVDAYSSAPWFSDFHRPSELVFGAKQVRSEWLNQSGSPEPPVALPKTWLLKVGYKRAGPLDVDDAPASRRWRSTRLPHRGLATY